MSLNPQSFSVPFRLTAEVERTLEQWRAGDRLAGLWDRDAGLWTGSDESAWLGWLEEPSPSDLQSYAAFASGLRDEGFSDLLLLGMGGSVLSAAVFAQAFGRRPSFPRLRVLDSLDPRQIRHVEAAIDLEHTLVVVSSKSGSTLESRLLMARFLDRVGERVGADRRGRHFVAITDPGSELEAAAREKGFRQVFAGRPQIGGRFSALSAFGLVPLAAIGVDVGRFMRETAPMMEACGRNASVLGSPGVLLGVILGVAARAGHDKITLVTSPSISDLGSWLEQLLAESTGKSGQGLIPVTGGIPHSRSGYGSDRLFVSIRLDADRGSPEDDASQAALAAVEESGQPVVRIAIRDAWTIGQELFRWEIATSVAGSLLGINPFDQPDVEASKVVTGRLMGEYESAGAFPPEEPTVAAGGLEAFLSEPLRTRVHAAGRPGPGLEDCVGALLESLVPGDYCGILAWASPDAGSRAALEALREAISGRSAVPVTLGFGPRYLHSSGQVHKGGPNTGAFLVLVAEDADDLEIPGYPYSFGVVKAAQARADAEVLAGSGRRVLRVVISGDFAAGVGRLADAIPGASEPARE